MGNLKSTLFLLVVINLVIFLSLPIVGASQTSRDGSVINWPTKIGAGIGTESFTYQESSYGVFIEEKGTLSTVNLSVRFPLIGSFFGQDYSFGQIEGSFSRGNLTYDGQTWGGDPLTASTRDRIYRFRSYIGPAYAFGQGALEPYGGFWARYWHDKVIGQGGYRREIKQFFWLGGANLRFDLSPSLSLTVGGSGSRLKVGSVKSYLSDVNSGFNNPTVEQDSGSCYRAYIKSWTKLLGFVIRVKAYGRYLDIASSDTAPLYYKGEKVTVVHEPANTTTIYGINLNLVWG
ncbi:MAG: hypothetical protein ABEJ25_02035 [Candidatus Bipolaricaulia bacterium]